MYPKQFSLVIGVVSSLVASHSCAEMAIPNNPEKDRPGSVLIAEGSHSAIESARQTVIGDKAAFAALWAEHSAHQNPVPVPPAVDFTMDSVVAVFAGNQPTGGHALALTSLEKTASGWALKLSLVAPGPDCMTTQAITQPWMMVRIPGHDLPVNIHITPVQRDCGQ